MSRVKDIPRTAAFAWSPSITSLSIATGTRAGAVDADFSSDTKLELWDLDSSNEGSGSDLVPSGSLSTDSRFYDLAWSEPTSDRTHGIIAGGLENGSLDLWDASKVRASSEDALMSRTTKHSGPIKALQFNPHRSELLATSGVKGELYITDLNNASNPYRLGTAAARADDFDALDWNKQVAHILATAGSGGFVTVWDVKSKKESLTLNNYGRKPVSAIAWDPDLPTKLATAVPSDQDPLILMWDLRNSSAPERIMKGHEQGVLSLSWCREDSSLLLSCGKDNRNICWDPHAGDAVGEFPIVTNWTFQTRWSPRQLGFLATASFDGKIAVQTIQNTNGQQERGKDAAVQATDGADFFAKAHAAPSGSSFSLAKAPKWLRRPTGASFGFGGKLVSFRQTTDSAMSQVKISSFAPDPSVELSISEFAQAMKESDLSKICDTKIDATADKAGKTDWQVIRTLVSETPRKGLLDYLGFPDGVQDEVKEPIEGEESKAADAKANGVDSKGNNRLSSFFDNADDNQTFLADLAASKGAKTNNPFHIFTGKESDADRRITKALMLGTFEDALGICLKENRMSDAFMIAICGGQKCIDKAQAAYFAQQSDGPNYLRLLASVVGKNLWDIVYNADLTNWTEAMATLCTFADENEFPDLCEALGDRLDESADSRLDACFCYLAGSKLEKIVPIWLSELQKTEKELADSAGDESAFTIHIQALQSFIEKVSIFRRATAYVDKEGQEQPSSWRLESLYSKYAEYADVVAGYGHLELAAEYLSLLPAQYAAADVARNRLRQARRKAQSAPRAQQNTNVIATRAAAPTAPVTSGPFSQQQAPLQNTSAVTGGYAPSGYQPYQPSPSPYAPSGPFTNTYQPPLQPSSVTQPPPPTNVGPPTSQGTANGTNWNDLPVSFGSKPPTRRGTPAAGGPPVTSPFANQASGASASNTAPLPSQRASTPLAPPPKGSAPPRVSSPMVDRSYSAMDTPPRPTSSAANSYAPPPSQPNNFTPPASVPPPRVASPYNAPPSTGPPSNRYAPAAGVSRSPAPPAMGGAAQVPRHIAPNPYASQQSSQPSSQYAAAPTQKQSQPPPLGPPPSSRGPPIGPPPGGPRPSSASPATQASSKHPAGDRSHIPLESAPIYEILSTEMQRIKGLAPANYRPQVLQTEKQLNTLFDALNNDDINAEHVAQLRNLAQAMRARDFDQATAIHTELVKQMAQAGPWMVAVKRLVTMSKATPV